MPGATTSESQLQQHTLTLTLTATGELLLGTEATTLETLPEQVQARRVGDLPLLVIIRADEAVPHGQVVAVMDSLRTLTDIQLGIATQPSSAESGL